MKVENVKQFHGEEMEIDGEIYQRFGADCWYRVYGMSVDACSFAEEPELEAAYQEYMRVFTNRQDRCERR